MGYIHATSLTEMNGRIADCPLCRDLSKQPEFQPLELLSCPLSANHPYTDSLDSSSSMKRVSFHWRLCRLAPLNQYLFTTTRSMNLPPTLPRKLSSLLLVPACAALALSSLNAQPTAPAATRPAATPVAKEPVKTGEAADGTIVLTPFTVDTSKDRGYSAENTLAGSRLSSKLEDLAASITVVTKQQLEDTGALDINDVFKYEAGTEGSSSYTPVITDRGTSKDSIAGYSLGNNGDTTTNAQSNRLRGISAPDAALNYFPTNNRIPFDSYNVQRIEISRGPNSLLFGLGSPAGIVNQTVNQAAINRNTSDVSVRTDQNGSFRTTLSINRDVIHDKLAIYGAFLYDDRQFERKPSRDLYRRQFGALTYKPFKKTVIRGFAENYQNDANRPNFLTPRDLVTPWLNAGRPVYDPTTRQVTVLNTGAITGPYVNSTASPGFVTGNVIGASAVSNLFLTTTPPNTVPNPQFVQGIQFEDTGRPVRLINGSGTVDYFARNPLVAGVSYPTAQTNPATALPGFGGLGWVAQDPRYLIADRQWSSSNYVIPVTTVNPFGLSTNPTFATVKGVPYGSYQLPGVTNKGIYNWEKYNIAQTNFARTRAANYNLEIEQQILPDLFFSAAWLRQDIESTENYTMGQLTGNTISIDTNQKLPDGRSNPYLGLPFISEGVGGGVDTFYNPQTDDNLRAMLAYDLDLSKRDGFMKWLGKHRLLALWTSQDSKRAVERWRNGFVDGDDDAKLRYVTNLTLPGQQQALSTSLMRKYYLANPGQAQAVVSHSSGFYGNQGWDRPVTSQVEVYNYTTGQFQNDRVIEQALFSSAGSFRTKREVRSWTLGGQSNFWDDRLITTLGWRHDKSRTRNTNVGVLTDALGVPYAPALTNAELYSNGFSGIINHDAVMRRWGRWDEVSGNTKTLGAAFRPLKGWSAIQNLGGEGSVISEFFNGLTLYYNQSENFNPPASFQTDYFKKPLTKPTGEGRDGGFGFNIFKNKLVARVNWYDTKNDNERTSTAGTLLGRLAYSDTTTGLAWASAVQRVRNGADTSVVNWNSDALNNVSDPVNQQKIYDLIKLPLNYYTGITTGGTQNSFAKGAEIQLTYNPTNNWTIKVTADKQRTTYTNIVPQYDAWLKQRLPIWQTNSAPEIADFIAPGTTATPINWSLKNFWTGYGFTNVAQSNDSGGNTSPQAYFNNVVVSQVALAKALEGVTTADQRQYHASLLTNYRISGGRFKGVSFGGSERWESRAAIGYLGKVTDPTNAPGVIGIVDPTKPVYDSGNYYTDLWIAYSRKIYHDKVGLKVQLNVYNATEGGRLQATAINFDGTPWSYRIIDPRQFVLTTTFSF